MSKQNFSFFRFCEENIIILVLLISSFIVQLSGTELLEALRYQHKEVSDGQWWRIITANLCHSNWYHWILNMLGLILMDYLFQPFVSLKNRAFLMLTCLLSNVLLLHLFLDLYWYVGLSGTLHGYLMGNALISMKKIGWMSYLIILVVSGKLISEIFWEINEATTSLIDANVIEEAHLFGAISGIAYYFGKKITGYFFLQKESKSH